MNLNHTFFNLNCDNLFSKSAKFSKIIFGVLFLMVISFVAADTANAQSKEQSVCQKLGYQDSRVDLDGIWKLSFTAGTTNHETFLIIKKQVGMSLTRYYDSSLKRQRKISQIHVVCQAKNGVVILGFEPTDIDTNQKGENLTYSADNYVFSVKTDGTVSAMNVDDSGNTAEIKVEYLEELPSDVKMKNKSPERVY